MIRDYSAYGNVKVQTIEEFMPEPIVDISFALNTPETAVFVQDIKANWDNPDDFEDIAHEKILPYGRVYRAGKERLLNVLKAIDKKKRRKGSTARSLPIIWDALSRMVSEQSSYFMDIL